MTPVNTQATIPALESLSNVGKTPDVVIISGDGGSIISEIAGYCIPGDIPFINVGYLNDISTIGPFWTTVGDACPLCNIETRPNAAAEPAKAITDINDNYSAPSAFANNAIAASMAMIDIYRLLGGQLDAINSRNCRIGINNRTFERIRLPLPPHPECLSCSCSRIDHA